MRHDRIDAELLAQLLWDFFGPHEPRHFLHDGPNHGIPDASERSVATYRQCAKDIVDSLIFAAASVDTHPKDGDVQQAPLVSGAVPKADAQ